MAHCLCDFCAPPVSCLPKSTVCWGYLHPWTAPPPLLCDPVHPPSSPCTPGGTPGSCPLSRAWVAQPVLQSHRPSLSTHHPCVQPLLGRGADRPHGPLLGHPGSFTLNSGCSVPSPDCVLGACLSSCVPGQGVQTHLHVGAQLLWTQGQTCPWTAGSPGPRAVLTLGGPLPTWDWGAPSKAGSVWEAFGSSVNSQCGDKLPKAGGQGILGSGGRPGSDMVLWGRARGQELSCWSPPRRPSLPGPLCPELCRPRLSGPPPPILRPPGGSQCTSCRAPAQPGVRAAPSGPVHSLPGGPLWLGACSNSRPQPSTQMEPGPAPAPAHTETTWGDATGMALVRHVRQVSGWRGRQPNRWTDGTSQLLLHGCWGRERGQRLPQERLRN